MTGLTFIWRQNEVAWIFYSARVTRPLDFLQLELLELALICLFSSSYSSCLVYPLELLELVLIFPIQLDTRAALIFPIQLELLEQS